MGAVVEAVEAEEEIGPMEHTEYTEEGIGKGERRVGRESGTHEIRDGEKSFARETRG
jgi:hypothetical protein